MKHLQVRMPDDLHAALKTLAEQDRRSLNAEIVVLLEQATVEQTRRSWRQQNRPVRARLGPWRASRAGLHRRLKGEDW